MKTFRFPDAGAAVMARIIVALLVIAGCAAPSGESASALALSEPPTWLDYAGPGCRRSATEVAVSSDGSAATLLFSALVAPPITACAVTLDLTSDANVAVRGFSSLGSHVDVALASRCRSQIVHHRGSDDEFTIAIDAPACGRAVVLVVASAGMDALAAVDSVDVAMDAP
jgi:hypothetical protein